MLAIGEEKARKQREEHLKKRKRDERKLEDEINVENGADNRNFNRIWNKGEGCEEIIRQGRSHEKNRKELGRKR